MAGKEGSIDPGGRQLAVETRCDKHRPRSQRHRERHVLKMNDDERQKTTPLRRRAPPERSGLPQTETIWDGSTSAAGPMPAGEDKRVHRTKCHYPPPQRLPPPQQPPPQPTSCCWSALRAARRRRRAATDPAAAAAAGNCRLHWRSQPAFHRSAPPPPTAGRSLTCHRHDARGDRTLEHHAARSESGRQRRNIR